MKKPTHFIKEKKEDLHLRSEEVQEILTYVPNWMIRWGMTFVFTIIVMLLFISWLIKYPDIIATEVIVTTSIPPEKIFTKINGKMDVILVENNSGVNKNELLAVIENSANYKDVILLKSITDSITVNNANFYFPIEKLPVLTLGEITTDFIIFENNYSNYLLNRDLNPYKNEDMANKMSVTQAKQRLNILIFQKELNSKELLLKEKDLIRKKTLFTKGVIAEQEYEMKQLELIQSRKSHEGMDAQISQLKEALSNSKKLLKGGQINKTFEETNLFKNVIQSFFQLKKSIKDWEFKYALKSSIKGKVSFLTIWNENQTVNSGENIFTIIPSKNSSYLGKVMAPAHNSGKIKAGQSVNVRLSNYPDTEFGTLNGLVENISLFPDKEGYYLIDVSLDRELITSYNKKIEFQQEMIGSAEIITEDLRLIERFFYQLKTVFKR
jgi:multidrug efflux pump subunit AcrA (membrane-fusion protein)